MNAWLGSNSKRFFLAITAIALTCISLLPACKKEENEQRILTVRDKMLGNWRRSLRAYDLNGNHRINSSEVDYSPSTRATDTILLSLVPDATYTRSQVFKGVSYPQNGTWHLQQNDAELVLQPSTSTSHVDTFRLDTISQSYFLQHSTLPGMADYYESFVRPN